MGISPSTTTFTTTPSGLITLHTIGSTTDIAPSTPTTAPVCSSFTYSVWSTCQANNTQTRTMTSSLPAVCSGGTQVLSQSCSYATPVPNGGNNLAGFTTMNMQPGPNRIDLRDRKPGQKFMINFNKGEAKFSPYEVDANKIISTAKYNVVYGFQVGDVLNIVPYNDSTIDLGLNTYRFPAPNSLPHQITQTIGGWYAPNSAQFHFLYDAGIDTFLVYDTNSTMDTKLTSPTAVVLVGVPSGAKINTTPRGQITIVTNSGSSNPTNNINASNYLGCRKTAKN